MYFAPYVEPVVVEPTIGTNDYILIGITAVMVIMIIAAAFRTFKRRAPRKRR